MTKVIADITTGHRMISGTEFPICTQLCRVKFPGKRVVWQVVVGLCNGFPLVVREYPTKRQAVSDFNSYGLDASKGVIP